MKIFIGIVMSCLYCGRCMLWELLVEYVVEWGIVVVDMRSKK